MASGYDSGAVVSSQKETGLRQEFAETLNASVHSAGTGGHLPVFDGFVELGLTGRDIAEIVDVTPPTVSKWRMGKVSIPAERLVFLTLVLAHLLDDVTALDRLEAEWNSNEGGNWCRIENARTDAARAHLAMQDVLNKDALASDVRGGAKCFRVWWSSGAATALQEKRFRLALDGQTNRDLNILKARVSRL